MLTLAAYRFETPQLGKEELIASRSAVLGVAEQWLSKKGVVDPAREIGSFRSKTIGGEGAFTRSDFAVTSGDLTEIVLSEPTEQGHTFVTSITIVNAELAISVFITLSVTVSGNSVAPTTVYPRCPVLVRDILSLRSDWMFGGCNVPGARAISIAGKQGASVLVGDLMNAERSLPVIVVSDLDGEPVWEDLPEKLAVDLAGLSSVVRIDGEASWALNDLIGKSRSCYLGAVRIYWPLRADAQKDSELRSIVWTAERLLSNDMDGRGLSRFTTSLRRQVMSVAALAVNAPIAARRIKSEHSRARLIELQKKADANSEELELARLFIEENESLKNQLEQAKSEVSRQAARAEVAEYALELQKSTSSDEQLGEEPESSSAPKVGEVRFYKKTHSKPSYDVLVRIADCGHNSWQSASKADKAKNGIERLESSSDWKHVYHCGSCQGGGVWKVVW